MNSDGKSLAKHIFTFHDFQNLEINSKLFIAQ